MVELECAVRRLARRVDALERAAKKKPKLALARAIAV
jgi:hypothetical protein